MLSLSRPNNKKAIAYYRHSAEDKQENSVQIQREQTEEFAKKHSIEIIHEEADEGVSGLTPNRPSFQRMFKEWVLNAEAPQFDYILVFDVSRWGRFQNPNTAAHYEHQCEECGKKIVYVERGFPQEGQQLTSSLITSIDRFMAAEYSRVLSEKVFHGCVKVSEQGYSAGGTSCYGMGRLLLDLNKEPIRILKRGEHKQISNERVTFVPLKDETTETVKRIFELLVNNWYRPVDIAEALNLEEVPSASGGKWDRDKVVRVLTNETYAGTRIYNKTWGRLKQKHKNNPRNQWVVVPNAFEAIVEPDIFSSAQEHLYWLMPSKWKRGIFTANKIKEYINGEIKSLLVKNNYPENKTEHAIDNFPIIYSVSFYRSGASNWCFMMPETTRNYDAVLGVSIALDKTNPIDGYFLVPTNDFGQENFILFSEKDECYNKYKIDSDQIYDHLGALVRQIK